MTSRDDHGIHGEFRAPVCGQYLGNPTRITGRHRGTVARAIAADVELALDAAPRVAPTRGRTPSTGRAITLNTIADRLEENLEALAMIETIHRCRSVAGVLRARPSTRCLYLAHAAFGGDKQRGIRRKNRKIMRSHSRQTTNLLVRYSPHALCVF